MDAPGLPFAAESADVVIMSELIEHLVDTDSALDEALRVLKPGGSLLLSTPNLAAWYNRGLVALGVQPIFSEVSLRGVFGRPGSQVAGHLHLFTRRALVGLLAARGFSSIRRRGRELPRRAEAAAPRRPGVLLLARGGVDPARPRQEDMTLRTLAEGAAARLRARDADAPGPQAGVSGTAARSRRWRIRGTRAWSPAGTPAARHAWPALAGLVLGLLALGPGLAPGFLLSYDMVFVPRMPFSAALLGLTGGPPRAVPSDAVVAVASLLLPADILQKLILLLIFVAACSGAAALLAAAGQAGGARCRPGWRPGSFTPGIPTWPSGC